MLAHLSILESQVVSRVLDGEILCTKILEVNIPGTEEKSSWNSL